MGPMMMLWSNTSFPAASVVLIALACASEPEMAWYKPGAADADFYRMRGYCVNQAGVGVPPANAQFVACMQSGGWVQVPKAKVQVPGFTWLRSDGTPATQKELEAAKKRCQASSPIDPASAVYGEEILECIQSDGYRLVEEKRK